MTNMVFLAQNDKFMAHVGGFSKVFIEANMLLSLVVNVTHPHICQLKLFSGSFGKILHFFHGLT